MPLGIPKTPFIYVFEFEGKEHQFGFWIDIYNRLFDNQVLFLSGEVNDYVANLVAGCIIVLGREEPTLRQCLLINTDGGFVNPGMSLFDTIQWTPAPIHTIAAGMTASIGTVILVGGTVPNRSALPSV